MGDGDAVSSADELVADANRLRRIYDDDLGSGGNAGSPRSVVSDSWQRSLAALVDPENRTPPVVYAPEDLPELREGHPLREVMPLLRRTLVSIADEAMHVMLVTDADGHILWRDGAHGLLRSADDVGLFEGTRWTEDAIGTNAMGTALAVDAPVRIHSAEHLVRAYHDWTCVAAPVHDPDTGSIVGAIDISGPLHTLHPALVQLVSATAQLAENQLRVRLAIADERLRVRNMPHLTGLHGLEGALLSQSGRVIASAPYGRFPERVRVPEGTDRVRLQDGREMVVESLSEGYLLHPEPGRRRVRATERASGIALRFTGAGTPLITIGEREAPASLRPAEILTALALHPGGLSGEQLTLMLYGDEGNPTTLRGEIHRLRALLGTDVLLTRPYRLTTEPDADFLRVRAALRAGRVGEALEACHGPLLPRSDAPAVRDLRDELTAGLRNAVLATDDVELTHRFAEHPLAEEDLQAHERLLELLGPDDPRRAAVAARAKRLLD
ncbi:helix-turn-helix domain-containing protein [Pseudonocardia sp. KRD291]|uniref:helix-turn-helix domain-containing protein n=1 Tax=Pseudonocardia sp. KRD291 TaxID=2792007 RepID=UPI001C49DCE2|nr:helix-turn-helix domain-containing protein [Pseudonocardia sp. KRD291]MBW0105465.1 GAF domain-containing protein [Pseudonocardia sp. KRD291]